MIKLQFVLEKNLTRAQKQAIKKLQQECFSDVPQESIEEDFIAKEFGRIFAYKYSRIVGMLGLMKRKISFENVKGEIKYDTGTMFIPVCSNSIYDFIMKSKKTFHYGKGYW